MGEKISATIEDYLGVMYVLERDGDPATGVRAITWWCWMPSTART